GPFFFMYPGTAKKVASETIVNFARCDQGELFQVQNVVFSQVLEIENHLSEKNEHAIDISKLCSSFDLIN
ncbi:hypothetical protein, partial [Desulfovibrio sp. TomC]|uniref:hypothetical protein n=1 Tax=Desulfovibrio sp. TomC TaxID=1562888 RepID=UPI001E6177E6